MADKLKKQHKELIRLVAILLFLGAVTLFDILGQRTIRRQQLCDSMGAALTRGFASAIDGKIQARAISVYDFTRDIPVYGVNEALPLPLASLTKLMTVRVAMKSVTEDAYYTVTKDDVKFDGATGFVPGDVYSVHDLLEAALIASSNNAATMVARSTGLIVPNFISLMNFEAQNLKLASLRYDSVTGLDTDDLRPTVTGSASDVLKLLYRDVLDMPTVMALGTLPAATIRATDGRSISLANTDEDVDKIDLLKASKTGYTITAGGNLAVLWQEPGGDTIGAAVLGSTVSGRFTDILLLHDAAGTYANGLRALPAYCTR